MLSTAEAGPQLASPTYFFTISSLLFLALAVIGGINSWIGAFIGATLFTLTTHVFDIPLVQHTFIAQHIFKGQLTNPGFLPMLFGLGAIGLAQNPNGIVEQIRDGWGGFIDVLRWIGGRVRRRAPADVAVGEAEPAPVPVEAAGAEAGASVEAAAGSDGRPVSFPQGRLYHRPDCVLTVGKEGGAPVSSNGADLQPCPVCDPEPATTT